MIKILKKDKEKYFGIILFFLLILSKLILDYVCENVYWLYGPKWTRDADQQKLIVSWISYSINAVLMSFFLLKRRDLISIVYCLLFILNGLGFYSIFPLKPAMTYEGFWTVSAFWTFFTIVVILCPKTKEVFKYDESFDYKISLLEYVIFAVSAAMTIAYSGIYGDFRIFISFDDVYAYRFEFLERSLPRLVSYTMRWLSGTILPYFFVRFLMCKKRILAAGTLLLGLMMYGIDGLKTTLLLYVVAMYFCFRFFCYKRKNRAYYKIVYEFIFLLCIAVYGNALLYQITGKLLFNTELYRIIIIPSNIADNYYNFIYDKEALLLRESIMRSFFASPYDKSISYLVTNQMNLGHQAIANTGLYGDAYANFKLFGVFLYPILYASVLKIWQDINFGKTHTFSVVLAFIMIWNAINISFFTWLLTGGVIILIVITAFKNKMITYR